MKTKPKALILRTDGTNCDEELFFAFQLAGSDPEYVHVNELRSKQKSLKNFQILSLPGGFSYGDDIASGKILAVELASFFSQELKKFVERPSTIIFGVCNGFQTLVRTGLLPFGKIGTMDATLTNNDSGHFECRWIRLKTEKSRCAFLPKGNVGYYSVNHGEGKFFADPKTLKKIEDQNLVVFRYIDRKDNPTQNYPDNPNGSLHAIAAVTDPTGRILGMMPHPEKFVQITQFANWRREKIQKPHGLFIFENMIQFSRNA